MMNAKIRVLSAVTVLALLGYALIALRTAAIGYAQGGGTIAIQSPNVEIDADSVGDVVTIGGNDNVVSTAVSPDPPQRQGSWLIALIVLLALGLAAVGVYHLLISGALNTAVDIILLWRKS